MADSRTYLHRHEIAAFMAEDPKMHCYEKLIEDAFEVPEDTALTGYFSNISNCLPPDTRTLALSHLGDGQIEAYLFRLVKLSALSARGLRQSATIELLGVCMVSLVGVSPVSSHFVHPDYHEPIRYTQEFYFHQTGVIAVENVASSDLVQRFPEAISMVLVAISAISLVLLGNCEGGPE